MSDLPLVSVVDPAARTTDSFAIFLSGDGGWADFDQTLARTFAAQGVPVVGWSTLNYFWSAKSPQQASSDLSRVIAHFSKAWGKSRVALVGYSFGANTLPLMVDDLSKEQQARIGAVVLISAGRYAQFEFSTLDWFNARKSGLPTLPAIVKLDPAKAMCIFGEEDRDSVCPAVPDGRAEKIRLPGGHHLRGAYADITDRVLARLGVA
ncbi:MAG: AcvB/VirJ family lysyl-phosphatidylglycerol hydrolase [Gammaproteobacteria bacterium]